MPYRHKSFQRQHDLNRDCLRRSALATFKLERGCADCGYAQSPVALDFDHVRGEKLFSVSRVQRGWDKTLAEIDKCDVVCANCHRVRTLERLNAATP